MSELFNSSYFSLLPNELLIKILRDVDTFTLLDFCRIYECNYFLKDRNVIKTIDLYKKYALENISQVSKRIAFEHVTTLNVNCLYWIPAAKLRKFISRLENLEILYAVHTKLSLTSHDTEIFSNSKIKRLAVSVDRDDVLGTRKIPTVEVLYLSFVCATPVIGWPITLDMVFPKLEKLWIDVEEMSGRELFLQLINAEIKTKIHYQVNGTMPFINWEHNGLITYYRSQRSCQPCVVSCEKFNKKPTTGDLQDTRQCWRVMDELHCNKPYGPNSARRLYSNANRVDNVFFEDLNFHHPDPGCNQRCREAVKEILKSPNCKNLKRLCAMMCFLENDNIPDEGRRIQDNGFKRKRVGVENAAEAHSVEEIFRNFTGLEYLEIFVCQRAAHHRAVPGYSLITVFENLRSLTLEVPITVDGSFLVRVLRECKQLEILRISSLAQHEQLNFNIVNAIPYGTALKDFRYENQRIQLDKLLECLCLIKSERMERIVMFCKTIDKFSAGPLEDFLEQNPQLVFLYFVIKEITVASMRRAQQTLNLYKKKHPTKVFFIKKENIFDRTGYPIPDIHYKEMVKVESNVACLSVLKDFSSF